MTDSASNTFLVYRILTKVMRFISTKINTIHTQLWRITTQSLFKSIPSMAGDENGFALFESNVYRPI
jgi:hypothetical protein